MTEMGVGRWQREKETERCMKIGRQRWSEFRFTDACAADKQRGAPGSRGALERHTSSGLSRSPHKSTCGGVNGAFTGSVGRHMMLTIVRHPHSGQVIVTLGS